MEDRDYVIDNGDSFYRLAQRFGGTCEDWIRANPQVDPIMLQVGQKVVLPELKNGVKGQSQFAEISTKQGREFAGDHYDEVEMEVEGVVFRVRRVGEGRIPHEIHLLLPRTEIHKIQPAGENGPCEVQIMISNLDIVHSPRLTSEGGSALQLQRPQQPQQTQQAQQTPQSQQTQQVQEPVIAPTVRPQRAKPFLNKHRGTIK